MSSDVYKAWHEELGHSEYRISITMAGYGRDLDAGDRLQSAFLEKCPELGPVISQNTETDTLTMTVAVNAGSNEHALGLADVAVNAAGPASGLKPGRIVRVEIEPAEDLRESLEGDLQTA